LKSSTKKASEEKQSSEPVDLPVRRDVAVVTRLVSADQRDYKKLLQGITELRGRIYYPNLSDDDELVVADFFKHDKHFGVAALLGDRVVGYSICRVNKTFVEICDIAVLKDLRRGKIATEILGFVVGRMLASGTANLRINVRLREHAVSAQLFFRAFGLKWIKTIPEHFTEPVEDCYVMQVRLASPKKVPKPVQEE
jgi:ribosomal protein S18 acetylase RimI-like enzyme